MIPKAPGIEISRWFGWGGVQVYTKAGRQMTWDVVRAVGLSKRCWRVLAVSDAGALEGLFGGVLATNRSGEIALTSPGKKNFGKNFAA